MNGQTEKMFGELPVSKLKTFLFGAGLFLLVWLIASLFGGLCIA